MQCHQDIYVVTHLFLPRRSDLDIWYTDLVYLVDARDQVLARAWEVLDGLLLVPPVNQAHHATTQTLNDPLMHMMLQQCHALRRSSYAPDDVQCLGMLIMSCQPIDSMQTRNLDTLELRSVRAVHSCALAQAIMVGTATVTQQQRVATGSDPCTCTHSCVDLARPMR